MRKVKVNFYVEVKNGIVKNIGGSGVNVPKAGFSGGHVKWHEYSPEEAQGQRQGNINMAAV